MESDRSQRWYVADLVVAITVGGEERVVVHRNTVLIHAADDERAYLRAIELGQQATYTDVNPSDRPIVSEFLGVASLSAIQDDLEDGAEIAFTESVVASVDDARKGVPAKSHLGVFRPPEPSPIDYRSKEVVEMMKGMTDK